MIAHSSSIADERLGSIPFWRKRSITSVDGRADRVERRPHRDGRLDRADVVVVEDLDDLGLLDAGHALRLLGVVDQQHPPRQRAHEVHAGDEPDRVPARVDRDRRPVVDVLDLVGDVGEQVVGADGQRLAGPSARGTAPTA